MGVIACRDLSGCQYMACVQGVCKGLLVHGPRAGLFANGYIALSKCR